MFGFLVRYFRKLLPDRRSQFASILVALLALAVTSYWLVSTVRDKWMEGISHPQQVVSFEAASSLPSFFGHVILEYSFHPELNKTS
jgi:hypothetical protein